MSPKTLELDRRHRRDHTGSAGRRTLSWLLAFGLLGALLAGCDDASLLGALVFSSNNRALRDVMVGGKWVVKDGIHPMAERTHQEYSKICESLFKVD